MRKERVFILRAAGGLAGGLLAAGVWAQPPVLPPGPPPGPAPGVVRREPGGPIRRAVHGTWNCLVDNWIGYPEEFVEPPAGFYVYENFRVMRAKANPHRFTLYRSDFLDGTARLSTVGAGRFNLLASKLRSWPGAVVIEWSPDTPGLAEARRATVLALLRDGGQPVVPERVVVAPSPYPGAVGHEGGYNYNGMATRLMQAPLGYSLTPNTTAATFSGSGGGTP